MWAYTLHTHTSMDTSLDLQTGAEACVPGSSGVSHVDYIYHKANLLIYSHICITFDVNVTILKNDISIVKKRWKDQYLMNQIQKC